MADPSSDRDRLERLAQEFIDRHRKGERPDVAEYAERDPDLGDEIRRLFPALAVMEDLKPGSGDPTVTLGRADASGDGPARERLGDYRILREVGRGGMGIVYEAEQESLGRRVALKVLASWAMAEPQQTQRFLREARSAAQLHHSNIVPVFGVGEHDHIYYYVMQFIDGVGLDEVLEKLRRLRWEDSAASSAEPPRSAPTSETGLPRGEEARVREGSSASPFSVVLPGLSASSAVTGPEQSYWQSVARIGVQVGEALQYAHDQGTLHRDIKPSNLLLDDHGTVWVADFGLAKPAEHEDLTRTGDLVGTLRYMAPERFRGECDVRSDIYGLGLTLFELLARRPAFDAPDRDRLIHQVAQTEPPRLRKLDPTIPRDLATIVHKTIEKDPSDRYASAGRWSRT